MADGTIHVDGIDGRRYDTKIWELMAGDTIYSDGN